MERYALNGADIKSNDATFSVGITSTKVLEPFILLCVDVYLARAPSRKERLLNTMEYIFIYAFVSF